MWSVKNPKHQIDWCLGFFSLLVEKGEIYLGKIDRAYKRVGLAKRCGCWKNVEMWITLWITCYKVVSDLKGVSEGFRCVVVWE